MYLAGQSLRWRQFYSLTAKGKLSASNIFREIYWKCYSLLPDHWGELHRSREKAGFLLSTKILEPRGLEQVQNDRILLQLELSLQILPGIFCRAQCRLYGIMPWLTDAIRMLKLWITWPDTSQVTTGKLMTSW